MKIASSARILRAAWVAPLVAMAVPLPHASVLAQATQATPQQAAAAGVFVEKLAQNAFGVLRDTSISKDASRAKFRSLLRDNFALDEAGLRLIRQHRRSLTPQQLSTYRATLPDFLVNTYSDRLYDFANAKVSVVRSVPRGTRGDVDVYTKVSDPKGGAAIDAIWAVKTSGPKPLIQNLTVNGVNIALTQEADFNSIIQRSGFDGLLAFMQQKK